MKTLAVTTSGKITPANGSKWADLPWLSWVLLLGTGCIALGPLTPTWDSNPNYSFGWWIPVVSLILFAERWPMRPARQTKTLRWSAPLFIFWGLCFAAFRMAAETDPEWRPGLWVLVVLFILTLVSWLWLEGGATWVRYFAFPVGFLLLCLPWPFEIEYPLVQGLMRWNAILVADSLQGLGIFAEPSGNIIQLQHCQLGVEEACSGILSLQASLVMGCLLGDIYRLTVRYRLLLVLCSMLLALLGNYLRTLFLALMAFYSGPDAVPEWHDTAGYAILVFTAVGAWLFSLYFINIGGETAATPVVATDLRKADRPLQNPRAIRFATVIFCLALLAEGITQAWFGWKESSLVTHPAWVARMPTENASFKKVVLSDVTLTALRCDEAETGQWQDAQGWNWTVYWLRYEPKPYTRVVLKWHTPDNCLPSIGLTKDRDYPDFNATVNGLNFTVHPRRFLSKDTPVYLFWLVYSNRGNLPSEKEDLKSKTYGAKFQYHLDDIWDGYRGVGVETLEVAITGPQNYEDAKAGYLAGLRAIASPISSPNKQELGTSR